MSYGKKGELILIPDDYQAKGPWLSAEERYKMSTAWKKGIKREDEEKGKEKGMGKMYGGEEPLDQESYSKKYQEEELGKVYGGGIPIPGMASENSRHKKDEQNKEKGTENDPLEKWKAYHKKQHSIESKEREQGTGGMPPFHSRKRAARVDADEKRSKRFTHRRVPLGSRNTNRKRLRRSAPLSRKRGCQKVRMELRKMNSTTIGK